MKPWRKSILLLLCLFMCACQVKPRLPEPGALPETPSAFQHSGEGDRREAGELRDAWWEEFGDPELSRVAETALTNNLDVRKAAARIREYTARYRAANAGRYPALSVSAEAKKSGAGTVDTQTYGFSVPASFELDLWGRVAGTSRAAFHDVEQIRQNRRTLAQSMAAEAASLYLGVVSLERRLQVTQESVAGYEKSAELVKRRYMRGLATILDLRQAERLLYQARAQIPALEESLALAWQGLSVLLGDYPRSQPARPVPGDYYKSLPAVPPGLPSELLLRRPDVRAAEETRMALAERAGVARAARFPAIRLTGAYGFQSDELGDLFTTDSSLWNLAAGLTQSLFDAGSLKASEEAAVALYEEGLYDYAKTVLNAFQEVEQGLVVEQKEKERRERLVAFVEQAQKTVEAAESRYSRGLSGYLSVLEAKQTLYVAKLSLIGAETDLYQNRVFLHRALGGGWDKSLEEENGKP